jgi:ankyrin repeat protein
MSRFPVSRKGGSASRSPSPSPQGSIASSEQSALFDNARVLISHDQVPTAQPEQKLIRRRDRAIAAAARLKILIKRFNDFPEGEDNPLRQVTKEQCDKWQARRGQLISLAVHLTREIQEMRRTQGPHSSAVLNPTEEVFDPETVETVASQEIVEAARDPEIVEKPADPWLSLLDSTAPGQDTQARISDLLASGHGPGPELAQLAIDHKRYDVIQELVKRGSIDSNTAVDDHGEKLSLLAYGIRYELDDSYLMTLVDKNADAQFEHASGDSAPNIFALAVRRGWAEDRLYKLIKVGAPIAKFIEGMPVVAILYDRHQRNVLKHLIAYGIATDVQIDGRTFLGKVLFDGGLLAEEFVMGRMVSGQVEPFEWHTKFNLHAKGANGQTALHDLCEGSYDEHIFKKMISLGANPYAKNKDGKTPIDLVFEQSESAVGRPLRRNERRGFERMVKKNYRPRVKT